MLAQFLNDKKNLKLYILALLAIILFGGAALSNGIAEVIKAFH